MSSHCRWVANRPTRWARRRRNSVSIVRRTRSRHWTLCKRSGPIFAESPEGHLLYARSLAEVGRIDEALDEYHAVAGYFPGAEARVPYGMLLRMAGRNAEAKVVFNELLLQMKRAPKYLREAQAEWLSIAEKQLLN